MKVKREILDAIVLAAGKWPEVPQYDFDCLHFEDGRVYGANGHSLYFADCDVPGEPFNVRRQEVEAAIKASGRSETLELVNGDDRKRFVTETKTVDITDIPPKYPDFSEVIEKTDDFLWSYDIILSVAELERLVRIAQKHQADRVEFNINDPHEPVGVTVGKISGVIMPMALLPEEDGNKESSGDESN